jgi:hypothetical protein
MPAMSDAVDRESLRAKLRSWSELQRRIALERVVEQLPDADLERLLDGLVRLCEHCSAGDVPAPSLSERVDCHAAATRRGEFHGRYVLRNDHGQREPWQTAAWLAATMHLFDCALERARLDGSAEALASLRTLTGLVEEVDERIDELVVFEDGCACDHLGSDVARAERVLNVLE